MGVVLWAGNSAYSWRGPQHGKVITVLDLPVANTAKGYCSIREWKTSAWKHDRTQFPVVIAELSRICAECRTYTRQPDGRTYHLIAVSTYALHKNVYMYVCYLHISTRVQLFRPNESSSHPRNYNIKLNITFLSAIKFEWVQQSFVCNNVSACFIKHVYQVLSYTEY
jgi:hypothetical protein